MRRKNTLDVLEDSRKATTGNHYDVICSNLQVSLLANVKF